MHKILHNYKIKLGHVSAVFLCSVVLCLLPLTVKAQDTLKIGTIGQYFSKTMLNNFTQQTNITIEHIIFNDYHEMQQYVINPENEPIDSFIVRSYQADYFIQNGLSKKIHARKNKNFKNLAKRWSSGFYDKDRSYTLPIQWGFVGLIYNEDAIMEVNWANLFDESEPVYLSSVSMMDVYALAADYLQQQICVTTQAEWENLKNLLMQMTNNWSIVNPQQLLRSLISGRANFTIGTLGDAVRAKTFANGINYTQDNQDTMVWYDVLMQLNSSTQDAAFQQFLSYVMEPKVMNSIAQFQRNISAYNQEKMQDLYAKNFTGLYDEVNFYLVPACNANVLDAYEQLWAHVRQSSDKRNAVAYYNKTSKTAQKVRYAANN